MGQSTTTFNCELNSPEMSMFSGLGNQISGAHPGHEEGGGRARPCCSRRRRIPGICGGSKSICGGAVHGVNVRWRWRGQRVNFKLSNIKKMNSSCTDVKNPSLVISPDCLLA